MLGVPLIEVWYWGSLVSNYRGRFGSAQISNSEILEFLTTQKFAHVLTEEAGDNYGAVVKCCILGFGYKETQLDRE